MPPANVCIILAFIWAVTKIAPTIDHLLWRSTADSQLQAPSSDQIGGASVLCHVVRILISHIDHSGANFNFLRLGAHRRQQRKRRCQLLRKVMDTEVCAVHPQAFGLHGEVNRLQECVSS